MIAPFDSFTDITVRGGPVRVYRGGRRGAPPLLLLHGAMLDTARGVWRRVAPALLDAFDVIVVDLPRHGGSRPWRGRLDNDFYLGFIGDLLDQLGLDRVSLIGLSMGGGVATAFALEVPERVSALIAIGPGGIEARRRAQFVTWLALRTPGAMRLCTWYLARSRKAIRDSMVLHLVNGAETADFEDILDDALDEARAKRRHREGALDDWQIFSYGPFSMRLNLLPRLPGLSVPTLWVRGDQDPLVGDAALRLAASLAPGSRLVTMVDAGHVVTYDQSEAFTALARAFLDETLRQPTDGRP